jgi:hypothetical protein
MFGSSDVPRAAGDAGAAVTTGSGVDAAPTWVCAWAADVAARVVAAVKTVKRTLVILFVLGMPALFAAGVPSHT